MLKKRLIGVVTVKNGCAVQSFGYRRYLPLGRPEWLVENLDRWGADEILVQCIDRTAEDLAPDFELIDRLARLGLGTPLVYGGGIRSADDGVRAVQAGADRLVIDSLLRHDRGSVVALGERLGTQALIAAVPVRVAPSGLEWLDYRRRIWESEEVLRNLLSSRLVSEVLVIDCENEGKSASFRNALVDTLSSSGIPLIAFGGISEPSQMADLLANPGVAAVAVGNFLNYRELSVQNIRKALADPVLRREVYTHHYSMLDND